jgi:hypothetical protein
MSNQPEDADSDDADTDDAAEGGERAARAERRVRADAKSYAAEHAPGEALAMWMQRYAAFIATKRGLAPALHSGNPAFESLRGYFEARVRPAMRVLLEAAIAAGEVRDDVDSDELLHAVASLCMPAQDDGRAQRMVAVLVDGLRCKVSPQIQAIAR